MRIIDGTKGIFHNHIVTEEDGIELRVFFLNTAQEVLTDFIFAPDPNDLAKIGQPPNWFH